MCFSSSDNDQAPGPRMTGGPGRPPAQMMRNMSDNMRENMRDHVGAPLRQASDNMRPVLRQASDRFRNMRVEFQENQIPQAIEFIKHNVPEYWRETLEPTLARTAQAVRPVARRTASDMYRDPQLREAVRQGLMEFWATTQRQGPSGSATISVTGGVVQFAFRVGTAGGHAAMRSGRAQLAEAADRRFNQGSRPLAIDSDRRGPTQPGPGYGYQGAGNYDQGYQPGQFDDGFR